MDSGRLNKKPKIRAEEEEEEQVDKLSNLPEVLIQHILSFMDTQFAVRTCLLSTRWKSLWASLPTLSFNCLSFRKLDSFPRFVSQVLRRRRNDVDVSDCKFSGRLNKKPKIRVEEEEEEQVDRLSNLLEVLIQHILSVMDTQYAVRTCLLSTRWKSLWISLPTLSFNCLSFHKLDSFLRFVSQVLQRRRNDVDVSYCKFSGITSISPELQWKVANYLRSHRVQTATISTSTYKGIVVNVFPIFDSNSLKQLKLITYAQLQFPMGDLNLPALTTLHFEGVALAKFDSINLFSKCLNLRKLALMNCSPMDLEVFNISCPQLTCLTIWDHWGKKQLQICGFGPQTHLFKPFTFSTFTIVCAEPPFFRKGGNWHFV